MFLKEVFIHILLYTFIFLFYKQLQQKLYNNNKKQECHEALNCSPE